MRETKKAFLQAVVLHSSAFAVVTSNACDLVAHSSPRFMLRPPEGREPAPFRGSAQPQGPSPRPRPEVQPRSGACCFHGRNTSHGEFPCTVANTVTIHSPWDKACSKAKAKVTEVGIYMLVVPGQTKQQQEMPYDRGGGCQER